MDHCQPDDMDAWILGSGVQPLAAAVYLIEEAKVPPNRVHILETIGKASECTVNAGDPVNGYEYRSGAVPVFSGVWVEDLLCRVPSQVRSGKTALDDVLEFYKVGHSDRTLCTRFLAENSGGISCINTKQVSLGFRDRRDLSRLSGKTEQSLERSRILDHFHESFFRGDYWLMIATTFGFQPYHSAVEFHRYIRRFMHNGHGLNDFHPLYEGRVNLHQAITTPVAAFLESRGVDFQCHTTVTDIIMDPPDKCHRVSAIEWTKANEPKKGTITLAQNDIAIVSLGNIMSGATTGSNKTPPDLELIEIRKDLDENWLLWLELCTKHPKFGNAYNFCTRMLQSRLEVFTVTLRSPEFFNRFIALTGNQPGSVPYVTIKDSTWLMNMSVPRQPFFADQPPDVQVFWGYAMHLEKTGDFIKKSMINCSGEEIMMELLHHLKFPVEAITCDAITIPCILPRMTSMLLPRVAFDRPQIIPEAMTNLGLIGQFVEIPNEVVCSMDYGVKGAQMAVRQLMGLQEQKPAKANKPKKSSVFGLSRFL